MLLSLLRSTVHTDHATLRARQIERKWLRYHYVDASIKIDVCKVRASFGEHHHLRAVLSRRSQDVVQRLSRQRHARDQGHVCLSDFFNGMVSMEHLRTV